jgi:capsular polysaccharide biosynthesis protein
LANKADPKGRVPKEVLSFFTALGFEPVELDQLTFKDQVSLFQNAKFLAGPAGSDIAGLLLANPSAIAFTWVHEFSGPNSNYYANLAAVSRSTLIHFESKNFGKTTEKRIERFIQNNARA